MDKVKVANELVKIAKELSADDFFSEKPLPRNFGKELLETLKSFIGAAEDVVDEVGKGHMEKWRAEKILDGGVSVAKLSIKRFLDSIPEEDRDRW
jgi:hypothetical protein